MQGDHPFLLYHEKQASLYQNKFHGNDSVDDGYSPCLKCVIAEQVASLCGVHCLNTLLQGPTFSEMDLGQV